MKVELDATEEKLVRATFDIVKREGFKGATTKKIAGEAGLNEVTVFRKFKNKNNLIETTKEYYLQKLLQQLDETFSFTGDEEIVEYLHKTFVAFLNLPDESFSIIKVGMEEMGEISQKRDLISQINYTILDNFEAYFKMQIEKGAIRDVNPRVLGTMCYSMAFQSMVLLRINTDITDMDKENFAKSYIDILFNGIEK